MLQRLVVLVCLGLLVISGGALAKAKAKGAKSDLEQLQGTWDIVEVVNNGAQIAQDQARRGQVVFSGAVMTVRESPDEAAPRQFQITLHPLEKPKAIDMTTQNGEYQGSVNGAIYELQGDTLKLCAPNSSDLDERPTQFKSEEGSSNVLLILKRVKR